MIKWVVFLLAYETMEKIEMTFIRISKNIILVLRLSNASIETLKFQPHSCTVHVYFILNHLVIFFPR